MSQFYFDIWDGEAIVVDEEGLDLASRRAAEVEAALSLADIAKQLEPSPAAMAWPSMSGMRAVWC
ncbi:MULTISPECIES: DUF6894 family protein [Bradyrhizobium]|jgi:hypothetical protein|uniref:DUF6894 domain-containing protein n=1 Tax=Bradyrhizobium ottawaense TaxID=931866 RepID=A0ABV4FJ51_9BRAD|nr:MULTISPECIES: hypothetical protein [Bradyrhizobium]WLB44388.1 hypothetical protein QIH93_28200 [Bradyrhizobium ottawaense]WQN81689.1 hypothetical protein U7859_32660 [Bradyrhizobium ottawaense]BBO03714.1 hypothetical protein SG09_30640 [Bradyrhizobium ottawaense]GMO17315.1 hypothetical protein BwSH14_07790 [Bradyrhizobium ottawaense]GMO30113.1 hypothetical protein BwSF12_28070 [Bradyrhizobium ottawaense]